MFKNNCYNANMKQIKFMKRQEVVDELNEAGARFTDSAELKELKDLLKEIRNRKDTPVAGIEKHDKPEPQNTASKAPEENGDPRVPLDTERVSEGDSEALMRYVGGAGSLRIGKYAVTSADPFVLVAEEDVERLERKGFIKVSEDQLKAYYA